MEDKREMIMATAKDLVRDFLYYARKEDEELAVGEIQKAVKDKVITKDDIIKAFSDELNEWW